MLKELALAGILSSAMYSQVQLEHNPNIEQTGTMEYYWNKINFIGFTEFERETIPFTEKERQELSGLLDELPLAKKLNSINFPVSIAKGKVYRKFGETLTDTDGKFAEILLDTLIFNDEVPKYYERYPLTVDVDASMFRKAVLLHEMVHVYYSFRYGSLDQIFSLGNKDDLEGSKQHTAALGVECIYLLNNDLKSSQFYKKRLEDLMREIYPEGFVMNVGSKQEEILKINGYMKNFLKEKDYDFLFN